MKLAWEEVGRGEPILFIQGAGVPASGWKPQLDVLADRFHCVAFDNRGIGKSSAVDGAFTIADWRTYVGTRSMRRRAFLEILLSPAERASHASLDDYAAGLVPLFGRDLADPAAIALKQLKAASKLDLRSRFASLKGIPTLVLSGTHDRLALPAFGRGLASAIPDARYVELDAAHGLPITKAKEANRLVAEHLHSASAR